MPLDSLIAFERDLDCLAQNAYDWVPQSSKNWLIQDKKNNSVSAVFQTFDIAGNPIDSINLKYADANGDGNLNLDIEWTDTTTPFDSVANPTDHDIIAYHAQLNNQHNGNPPIPKNNSALHLTITTPDTV